MKIAFDVDVLAKQMPIRDYVRKVADWGYKYIEQSPHPRINPFYKHPLFSKECEEEYRKALKETGVEISSFIVVYRWSGPAEEQRQHAVANWKRMIQIAVDMGVPVINTEFSGDPNQQELCNGMFFRSMEELLPIIEREGLRVEIQSHPYDFCELNDETCDIVKSFRSKNLGYVYSASHGFFYDQGKGDVRHMMKYAGDELTHVLLADTWNQTKDCRYILNPPWLNQRGRADATIHQHTAMGEGEVDFDGIFETLREMDFVNKQMKPDAPKAGGDNIICVSYFGFPEKMDRQAPEALERLLHWASRGALDIDGMGEEIVSRLVESGRVADVADYYSLSEDELAALDMGRVNKEGEPIRLGHTVAKKLVAAIEASKGRPFARMLFGLGIRHVGKTTAELLADAFPSLEALAAFLASIPALDTPWDKVFQHTYCAACSAENCDEENCPHQAERNSPAWFLAQEVADDGNDPLW